jgi:hypothetical protein
LETYFIVGVSWFFIASLQPPDFMQMLSLRSPICVPTTTFTVSDLVRIEYGTLEGPITQTRDVFEEWYSINGQS